MDLRDSASATPDDALTVDETQARVAVTIAVAHALDLQPTEALADRLELECDPSSMVGARVSDDPAATALVMARIFDAVCGALAQAWPGRVGAGSCSLGALVQLDDRMEVVPGGEGGSSGRPGRSGWSSPIVETRRLGSELECPPWLEVEGHEREGSGGVGARNGGNGTVRRYRVSRPTPIRVCFDRTTNPPHGIDRAGPPQGSLARIEDEAGNARPLRPWEVARLHPSERLIVETCGGAGHGFPGYGDIEWDPSEWFGSTQKR